MEPGDNLVFSLEKLRSLLNNLRDRLNNSGVQRTHHMKKFRGDDCPLYTISMDFFLSEDYEDLREIISEVKENFDVIEN